MPEAPPAPPSQDLLFVNARLIDPGSGLDGAGSLLVQGGLITDHGGAIGRPDGVAVHDCAGACLVPGFVDMRASLGEPGAEHRETIASAALAAAAGGITTLAALPDGAPPTDDPALVRLLIARGSETGSLATHPYGAVSRGCRGEELAELGLLAEAGAVAFTDGGRAIGSARLMRLALGYAGAFVMHPGPMIRGVEIDSAVADDVQRSLVQEQVEMGVAIRMAVLDALSRNIKNVSKGLMV